MKIFAAAIWGECHQFNRILATTGTVHVLRGAAIRTHHDGAASMWGAFFAAEKQYGFEAVYPLEAFCGANTGPVERGCFDGLLAELLTALEASLPVDGVFLPLHGALLAEHIADTEGYLTERVRALVGPDVPIAVGLDLHANVTRKMCDNANILTAFRTTPHIDQYETGARAMDLLLRSIKGEISPQIALVRLPMLDALDRGRTVDPDGPLPQVLRQAERVEKEDRRILCISAHAGYPWADFAEAGPSVAVTHDTHEHEAYRVATKLIGEIWRTKDTRSVTLLDIEDVIETARAHIAERPLLVSDYTDNPGGGGYGDGTRLLAAMLQADLQDAVFFAIADPDAVAAGQKADIGATLSLELGGKIDPRFSGEPVAVTGVVRALSDGRYQRKGPFAQGTTGEMGPSMRIEVGGIDVIVTTRPTMADDREQLRSLGINAEEKRVIALKGMNHFRADYEPVSSGIVFADAKGICSHDYRAFPYKHLPRPIWPLDDMPF
ncbi:MULTISPECIES: M81 family metallopeptidase [Kordiimonas]|jgi:microcystin degradation protein MlrC|uniref:M81 family metallopeptidase n=1 Tax=Kordiimonas TaxID=288021 RepID=UPI00257C909B|nr:M81 family metallopeptidase [Kordiimonas sp. UBA4487]